MPSIEIGAVTTGYDFGSWQVYAMVRRSLNQIFLMKYKKRGEIEEEKKIHKTNVVFYSVY